MARRRWVYTQAGKPLPGGPVEVEPVRRQSHSRESEVERRPAPQRQKAPDPAAGGWTDYVPDEGQ